MAAREELSRKDADLTYVDVKNNSKGLADMLAANGGVRKVPTIIEDGQTTVGFGGT
ncbi:MAG: glutaredoxin family protein [Acidobacteriota bacterium]|nr:MAG: glutaredoxin family protein [Acidobacteriota bacterium]